MQFLRRVKILSRCIEKMVMSNRMLKVEALIKMLHHGDIRVEENPKEDVDIVRRRHGKIGPDGKVGKA